MIRQLSGRKLIEVRTKEDGTESYSIHRLLQQKIVLDSGEQLKFDSALRKATRLVKKRFPESPAIQAPAPDNFEKCARYMPHVYSLLRAFIDAEEQFPKFERVKELAELFYDVGFYIWDRRATEYDGLAFLGAAERILDHVKEDENGELRADIHCISGLLRINMGCQQRDESLRRLQLARGIREHIYQKDPTDNNNDILLQNAACDYGILLINKYEYKEAECIFLDCLSRYRIWGSEEDVPFEYSKYYYNTGVVRMWQGDIDEAIRLVHRSVELLKAHNGEEGQYWDNYFMLACLYLQAGTTQSMQKALDLHLLICNAKLDLLGRHSSSTILSTYAVGAMYSHMGDLPTAMYVTPSPPFSLSLEM
jgi:tetratricopeptide (TPR) repeat protein